MPLSVLRLLTHDRFRSGEELSRVLGLSRASIHNLVERAREMGVEVHAVRGRGYRLAMPYSWLDGLALAPAGRAAGYLVQVHERLSSTNSHLLLQAQQGGSHKSVVAAEIQTAGRGRRGREWLAPLGNSLAFSVLWRFRRPLTALSGLSLAVGLAVVRTLHRLGVERARVKWPNDILVEEGKLAGILIETHGDMLGEATAVIGIGINVRVSEALRAEVPVPVADLAGVMDAPPDRNDLLLAILAEMDGVLGVFDRHGFAPFVSEWQRCHAWQGRSVRVSGAGPADIAGVARGVDATGALCLHTANGDCLVHSGEVSLRLQEVG